MKTVKKALDKLWHATKLSIIPSLSAAALLVAGTVAASQYSEFSEYILTFWKKSYFLEPELLLHTASWFFKVLAFGFIFSILLLIHTRTQEVALEKLREIDKS